MANVALQDNRGYFLLPQAPEGAGYYVYGTPGLGRGQYAHPGLLSAIFMVEREWQTIDKRRFGIGNVSLAGGLEFKPHKGHKTGLEVDVRALRKDGMQLAVTRFSKEYDRGATTKLIALFLTLPNVDAVFFNDDNVSSRVRSRPLHDDHFHVQLKVPT